MSDAPFFDPLPEPDDEGDSQHGELDLPWAPPVHVAGVVVPVAADVHRGDDVVVRVTHVVAYRRGLEVHVSTWLRPGTRREVSSGNARWGAEEEPRIGVRLADGTRLGHRHPYAAADDLDPTTGYFAQTSGTGGGLHSTSAWWLHPVPAGDVLEVVVEWEQQGVPESSVVLGLGAVRAAGDSETEFWDPPPAPDDSEGGWFAFAPMSGAAYRSDLSLSSDIAEDDREPEGD